LREDTPDEFLRNLRTLLEQDSDTLDNMKFNALHRIIVGLSNADLQEQIELDPDLINGTDANGRTPLMWAALRGHLNAIKMLLEYGANVRAKSKENNTVLHEVANLSCMKALIAAGAEINVQNCYGNTPVYCIIRRGRDSKMATTLLQNGADPNLGTSHAPIHAAAEEGNSKAITALLDYGADINRCVYDGFTAIMLAVQYSHPECVRLLRDKGARFDGFDEDGLSLLDVASLYANTSTLRVLAEAKPQLLEMGPQDVDRCWYNFNENRDQGYIGERESIGEERAAMEEIMKSVLRLHDEGLEQGEASSESEEAETDKPCESDEVDNSSEDEFVDVLEQQDSDSASS